MNFGYVTENGVNSNVVRRYYATLHGNVFVKLEGMCYD